MFALINREHGAALSRNGRVHDSFILLLCLILARPDFSHSNADSRHSTSRFFTVLPVDSTHWDSVYLLVSWEISLRPNLSGIIDQSAHLESVDWLDPIVLVVCALLRCHIHSGCQESWWDRRNGHLREVARGLLVTGRRSMRRVLSKSTLLMVVDLRWTFVKYWHCIVVLSWARHFYFRSLCHIFSLPLSEGLNLASNMTIRFFLKEGAFLMCLFQVKGLLKLRQFVSICTRAWNVQLLL